MADQVTLEVALLFYFYDEILNKIPLNKRLLENFELTPNPKIIRENGKW